MLPVRDVNHVSLPHFFPYIDLIIVERIHTIALSTMPLLTLPETVLELKYSEQVLFLPF